MQLFPLALFIAVGAFLLQATPAVGGRWPDSCGDQKVHNFEFGKLKFTDRLFNSTVISRPSSFLRVISFDETFHTKGQISYIQVLDQKRDGKSGCVYLNNGGVGFYNVVLHFKSARNNGVKFLVNIYGH